MQTLPFPLQKLPDRTAIGVEGPDAAVFLQGLVTADVARLEPGDASYAALLQPQGKILFDFFVLRTPEGFLIDCAAAQREDLIKRLGFYRLRAKVTIVARDDDIGIAYAEPSEALRYRDPRSPLLGWRIFAPAGTLSVKDGATYRGASLRLGIAGTVDIGSGELFPHEANLDQLGAVSFGKGCFIGQEVVSRMEHRGTARSRLLPVRVAGAATVGAELMGGGKTVGTIVGAQGADGLALIRLDRLKDAHEAGVPLLTEGRAVQVIKPNWAKFDVAGA